MDARWGGDWMPGRILGPLDRDAYEVEVEVPGTVKMRVRRERGELRYPKRVTRRQRHGK